MFVLFFIQKGFRVIRNRTHNFIFETNLLCFIIIEVINNRRHITGHLINDFIKQINLIVSRIQLFCGCNQKESGLTVTSLEISSRLTIVVRKVVI